MIVSIITHIKIISATITCKNIAVHTIDFQGDTNANKIGMLTNTFVNELFIANLGNDTLTGNGGTDVFYVGNN
jgi:hypothetical protein